jgi:hypothetical protein
MPHRHSRARAGPAATDASRRAAVPPRGCPCDVEAVSCSYRPKEPVFMSTNVSIEVELGDFIVPAPGSGRLALWKKSTTVSQPLSANTPFSELLKRNSHALSGNCRSSSAR